MLTDTAGQEEYRSLWATSNLKSDAFLLVYDITNPTSLDALDHFAQLIEIEEEERMDKGAVPPVKIVAGNKCDLQSQRMIRSAQGLEWARNRGCGFMETSAREMVNIEETFARKFLTIIGEPSYLTHFDSHCPPSYRVSSSNNGRCFPIYCSPNHAPDANS
jgi:small GTP-binding protein